MVGNFLFVLGVIIRPTVYNTIRNSIKRRATIFVKQHNIGIFYPSLQFCEVPKDYDEVYLEMARRGARVLALGYKKLGTLSHQQVNTFEFFLQIVIFKSSFLTIFSNCFESGDYKFDSNSSQRTE